MNVIIHMVEQYVGVIRIGVEAVVGIVILCLMAGMLKQLKRLNTNLKHITTNMQAYMDVVLAEEEIEEEHQIETEEEIQEKMQEKAKEIKNKMEQEKLVNAVLQEYFS